MDTRTRICMRVFVWKLHTWQTHITEVHTNKSSLLEKIVRSFLAKHISLPFTPLSSVSAKILFRYLWRKGLLRVIFLKKPLNKNKKYKKKWHRTPILVKFLKIADL